MSQTSQFKKRSKSSTSLMDLFWKRTNNSSISLAVSLMANLAKLSFNVLHKSKEEETPMNVVTQLYDRIHFIFLQFTESLTHLSYLEPDKQYDYLKLLPANPERVLTINYNLPPATTFFIMKGSLKPIYQLSE